jgi:predicted aspartyl protease
MQTAAQTLRSSSEGTMGKIMQKISLANADDEAVCRRGLLSEEKVRRIELEALVDTGATMLSIPEDLIQQLGLPLLRRATTRYGDGRRESRGVYGPVTIRVLGRVEVVSVLAGHPGQPALLGQIPLEGLDLHADPRGQRLIPNPESPDMPLVEVY